LIISLKEESNSLHVNQGYDQLQAINDKKNAAESRYEQHRAKKWQTGNSHINQYDLVLTAMWIVRAATESTWVSSFQRVNPSLYNVADHTSQKVPDFPHIIDFLTMQRPQKPFGAKPAKAYAGAGRLTQYFAVKPKPPSPMPGCGHGRPPKKTKTQHALPDGSAHNAPVNISEGGEQPAPPAPVANVVSSPKKKMRINWGKGDHRDLLEKAIQEWRKRMAGNMNNTEGCRNCYEFAKNMESPPKHSISTSNLLFHAF
jgi:hypothetical protein